MRYIAYMAAVLTLICTAACGDGSKAKPAASDGATGNSYVDSGRKRAEEMIRTCGGDTTAMSLFLLETRAGMGQLELEHGREAAEDYRRSFESYVTSHDPALARAIFEGE